MQQGGGLGDLSTEELVERAQRVIAALQQPPEGAALEPAEAARMPLPEDTWDADYGAMLERAYGKGVSSPTRLAKTVRVGGLFRRPG